jgi:uncharacterized membrane protein
MHVPLTPAFFSQNSSAHVTVAGNSFLHQRVFLTFTIPHTTTVLFTKEEETRIMAAIKQAEKGTSGEIRLFVEDFCLRDHPVERAEEVFQLFGMFNTKERNGVLLYLAEKSRHFAIWGDAGIHERVGFQFWEAEKKLIREHLQQDEAATGICKAVALIGDQLRANFPADDSQDHNELPDDIIYG